MLDSFLRSIFGSRNERLLKQYRKTVDQINALEPATENAGNTSVNLASPISGAAKSGAVETNTDASAANPDLLAAFVASLSAEQRAKLAAMLMNGSNPHHNV